ncbi:MAG: cyclopropane-fatty-acyl-phospholipid synthase family protein [Solirubrobacteraceae bacterium]
MALDRPGALRAEIERALPDRPFAISWWDGARTSPTREGGPTFVVRSPRAVGHLLRAPGQLGLGRAYVSGELDVDDMDRVVDLLHHWDPPAIDRTVKRRLISAAVRANGLTRPPPVPASELRPQGRRHSADRDRRSVTHHYDVSNDFFALFLDESMTYSCAIFSRGATTLEEAQDVKRELVCAKLELRAGERVLDVGCGWGSWAVHAATRHGVHVTGITLSEPQAARARQRAADEGVADQCEFHVMDWRDLDAGQFDAIASIGMVEHVGGASIDTYAERLFAQLRPGGRLLNHGIARLRHGDAEAGPFSERYVFPDAAPLHVSRVLYALERAGCETRTVECFREDYAETLRHWAQRLDEHRDEGVRLAGAERMRVWRLYLRTSRSLFETGFMSIFQVLAHKP